MTGDYEITNSQNFQAVVTGQSGATYMNGYTYFYHTCPFCGYAYVAGTMHVCAGNAVTQFGVLKDKFTAFRMAKKMREAGMVSDSLEQFIKLVELLAEEI